MFKRYASHAQQATVSKGKDGPGKRLGAKRSGGECNYSMLPQHTSPL